MDELGPSAEATLIRVNVLRESEAVRRVQGGPPEGPEVLARTTLRLVHELATLLFIAREYEEARPLLEGLLEVDPRADYNLLLGRVWLEQRQPEKAIPFLEKASRDSSTAVRARAALGRAYLDSGQAGRAVPHLEAALETDEDGSLHFQLARAYQANGQADLARETRRKFQEIQRAANARSQAEKEDFTITPP